jgi:hAT family C-terminal dimerisation region
MRTDFKDCYYKYQDRAIQMRSSKRAADAEKAVELALKDDDSDAELYSKQPKEFENEIEWKQWLKQPVVERKTEVLQDWKSKQFDFPIVSRMARDHLAIPAMSALSESVFSDGGNVVTKNRNRLSGDSVREIVCLRNWGIITEEDDSSDSDGNGDDN